MDFVPVLSQRRRCGPSEVSQPPSDSFEKSAQVSAALIGKYSSDPLVDTILVKIRVLRMEISKEAGYLPGQALWCMPVTTAI